MGLITGIAHVNLTVPPGTLDQAATFYGDTLGFERVAVPALQKDSLAWFDITPHGQQIHIAFSKPASVYTETGKSSRHPCFKIGSEADLKILWERVWSHFQKGGEGAPVEADEVGGENSGAKGVEYPKRFFARDYAGNRLEFSL